MVSSSIFFFFFFPRLITAVADWMSTILLHMTWLCANLECMFEICCTWLAENTGRKISSKIRHLGTIPLLCRAVSSQLRNVSTVEKNVKQQYLLHAHVLTNHNGELPPNGWDRFTNFGHPANFNGFHVLASLLQRNRLPEANQTLHDVWPSPGLAHCVCIFRGSCRWGNFATCKVHFASVQILRSPI